MTDAPPSGSRRAALRRRRRRQRRQRVGAALAVAALLTALVTVYFAQRDAPPRTTTVATGRSQQTLLLQVSGPGGAAVGSALLAHDPATAQGAAVLVPGQVLATAPGSQPLPYGQVLATLGADASRKAVADLLGVTVDASWQLDTPTAARLVDAVGGIDVRVDVPVVSGAAVLLQPGEQRVDGARALSYATYLAPGEQPQARLARLQEVLDGLLAGLPGTSAATGALLTGLGTGSTLQGTDVGGLAGTLDGLRADRAADALDYDTLPVVAVDTGAEAPGLRLDGAAARALVDRVLAASVPPERRGQGNRVLVFNGVGTPRLGDAVRDALAAGGLLYVAGGNASSFGLATTEVQVPDSSPASLALGGRVAAALGVPPSAVRIGQPTSVADAVVVVGEDFGPAASAPPPG